MKNFKGLFKDTTYEKNPEATWQQAKNVLLGEKFNVPVNENGTLPFHEIRGKVVGVIETNLHVVYFSYITSLVEESSIITVYDRNKDTLEEVMIGAFNFNRPIEGIYKYDFEGNLVVAWWDGVFDNSNPPRIAQLTNINLPLTNNILDSQYTELINLFPNITKGRFALKTIDGAIGGVYAYVTFKYLYKDNETVFKDVNSGISLNESLVDNERLINKGFEIIFNDLDYQTYDAIIVGLYIVGEEEDTAYMSEKIAIEDTTLTYKVQSLSNFTIIDTQEIIVPTDRFNKIETGTENADSLILGNVEKEEPFKFQKYANMLRLVPRTYDDVGGEDAFNLNTQQVMLYSEVYAMYIQLDLISGETTDWYHIPNLDYNSFELDDAWETTTINTYKLDLNNFSADLNLKKFHLTNLGSNVKFGLWQNKEVYPNDDEYDSTIDYDGSHLGGQNLKGKNITYHRVKDEPEDEHFTEIRNPIVGARITNWSGIPGHVRSKIRGIRIGFAKRDLGNSLIISNGVLIPAWSPQDEKSETDARVTYDKIETSLQGTTYQTASNMGYRSFNRAQFVSPETELYKPKFDFNMVMVNYLSRNFINELGATTLEENIFDDLPGGYLRTLTQNKFWWGFKSYDYKLPNNLATGSNLLDGGLFINFVDARRDLNYYKEADFLTVTQGFLGTSLHTGITYDRPLHLDAKTIFTSHNNSNYFHAGVSLMNIRDNLYDLNSKKIISSTVTLNPETQDISNTDFYIGDVQGSNINLNYKLSKLSWTDGGNLPSVPDGVSEISIVPLRNLSYSPLLSAKVTSPSAYALNLFTPFTGDIDILNSMLYGFDVNVTEKYAQYNDIAGYQGFNHKDNTLYKFPYRIIRSAAIPDETFIINAMRTFFVDAYHEMPRNKGDIVAIRGNDRELYIQLRFELFYAVSRDVMTNPDGDVFLTRRDIFDRPPGALSIKQEGYIGCEHKSACVMTRLGYITVDHKQGNIIIATPEVKIISDTGLRNFTREQLEFDDTYREEVGVISKAIDSPFDYIGFAIGVDESFGRIYISKLLPPVLQQNVSREDREYYQTQLEGTNKTIDTGFPVYHINPNSLTLSYSIDAGFWLCEHDLVPNIYWNFKKRLFALSNHVFSPYNIKGYVHELNKGLKGVYFGVRNESYIDIIFNTGEGSRKLESLELDTIFEFGKAELNIEEKTIDAIVVFNDEQCSGEILLDTSDYDSIRKVEGIYRVNNFRDIIINRVLPILNERGVINASNLDFNKKWYEKSYFISTFTVVRLIWKNEHQGSVYLNEIKAQSQLSKR